MGKSQGKQLSKNGVTIRSRRREKEQQEKQDKIGHGPIRENEAEDYLEPFEIGDTDDGQ